MINKILFLPIIILSFVLSGCGGAKLVLKPEAVSSVQKIALLRPMEPQYRMMDLGSPAGAMGAIGAIVIAVNGEEVAKSLSSVVAANHYSFSENLTQEISAQLQKSGYEVVVIDVPERDFEFLEDYSQVDVQGADAVLDVVATNTGYVTEHFMFSPEWRPEARVLVSLYSLKNSDVAYQETLMYGYHNPLMSATDIDANKEYVFKKKEDVFEKGDEVVLAGLDDAIKAVASHISDKLGR